MIPVCTVPAIGYTHDLSIFKIADRELEFQCYAQLVDHFIVTHSGKVCFSGVVGDVGS